MGRFNWPNSYRHVQNAYPLNIQTHIMGVPTRRCMCSSSAHVCFHPKVLELICVHGAQSDASPLSTRVACLIYISLSLYIYMYALISMYIYIYIHIHMYMYLSIYLSLFLSIYLSIYLSICIYVCLSVYLSLSLYMYVYIYIYEYIYIYIYIYIYALGDRARSLFSPGRAHMPRFVGPATHPGDAQASFPEIFPPRNASVKIRVPEGFILLKRGSVRRSGGKGPNMVFL